MKVFKYIFAILFLVFSLNSAGLCQNNPHSGAAVFPAGTLLKGVLQNRLSSLNSKIGDKVYLLIPFDVKIGEITYIPKKSLLIGQVLQTQKAREGKNGFVQINFEYLELPDGWGTDISAHVWSFDGRGIIGGEITRRVSYRKIPHYTETTGVIVQLIESGSRAMGKEKVISAGTEFIIVLDNDLAIKPESNL